MQRGTGTWAAGGNITATLFTQSGGTATRVIVNSVVLKATNDSSIWQSSVIIATSGGGSQLIGWGQWYGNSGQFVPLDHNANTMVYNGSALTNFWAWAPRTSTANTYAADVAPGSVAGPYSGLTQGGAIPLNLWMGPSDSIQLKITNNSYGGTYAYSFTTITES